RGQPLGGAVIDPAGPDGQRPGRPAIRLSWLRTGAGRRTQPTTQGVGTELRPGGPDPDSDRDTLPQSRHVRLAAAIAAWRHAALCGALRDDRGAMDTHPHRGAMEGARGARPGQEADDLSISGSAMTCSKDL